MQSRQEAEAECSKDSSCKGFYSPKCNESVVLCLDMADQEANGGCVYETLGRLVEMRLSRSHVL